MKYLSKQLEKVMRQFNFLLLLLLLSNLTNSLNRKILILKQKTTTSRPQGFLPKKVFAEETAEPQKFLRFC